MHRREFIILTGAVLSGCRERPATPASVQVADDDPKPVGRRAATQPAQHGLLDAGPADQFRSEGIHEALLSSGVYLIRSGDHLVARSAICTHKGCRLHVDANRSFFCKCHKARFDAAGHVSQGPAKRDLQQYPLHIDLRGHVMVNTDRFLTSS